MSSIALYLLKIVLCSGVLYAYYYGALRNRIFHQYNRFYLLAAVLFSLAFPLIPMPDFYNSAAVQQEIPLFHLLASNGSRNVAAGSGATLWNWQQVALVAYASVALFFLIRLAAGLWQIRKLLRHSAAEQIGAVSFVPTDHSSAPFSFFSWLFWKKEIDLHSEGGQSIFRHELVHIREHHTLDKLFLQILLVLFWINPFFWIIRRELQLIHEFMADKKAVGHAGTEALAAMILHSVYGKQVNNLVNPFFQQPIKRRLAMLHKTLKQPRNAYLGRIIALPLCALLLFAFSKKQQREQKDQASKQTNVAMTTYVATVPVDTVPKQRNNADIKEVHVNTNNGAKTITIKYKNGKQETLTEKQAKEKGLITPPPPPPPVGTETTPPPPPPPPADERALVVIDGKEIGTLAEMNKSGRVLKPGEIKSINVLKDKHATNKYGDKGKYGVLEFTTVPNSTEANTDASQGQTHQGNNQVTIKVKGSEEAGKALVVIDGKESGLMADYPGDSFPVKPDQIERVNVLKDKTATDKYGDKGKNGVIEIITKKS